MKKLMALAFAATVVLAGCGNGTTTDSSASSATSSQATTEEKVLRVGATGQSYPNAYREGEELVGFDVEVIETVAENLGYTVEWTLSDFSGVMGQLETDKIDTVANFVAKTAEREEKFLFSDTYAYAGATIVTHTDNADINTLEDLKGKTVSGVLGSNNVTNLQNFDTNGEITIRTYETRDGAMSDVVAKRVDGYVNSKASLIAEIEKNSLPLKFVGEPFVYEDIAFPFTKTARGEELQSEINAEIAELREDGTLKELSEKYFSQEDITVKAGE
jgi:putative amino-acid transport system substrate-binding protein